MKRLQIVRVVISELFRRSILILACLPALNGFGGTPGTLKWSASIGQNADGCPAMASDGTIYITSTNGFLYALDSSANPNPPSRIKWSLNMTNTGDFFGSSAPVTPGARNVSSPSIASDGTVYVSTVVPILDSNQSLQNSNFFFAVTSTGGLKWGSSENLGEVNISTPNQDPMACTPAIAADGTIYNTVDDGAFTALRVDGTIKWSQIIGGVAELDCNPVVGPDCLVYAWDGPVFALLENGDFFKNFGVFSIGDNVREFTFAPVFSAGGIFYLCDGNQTLFAMNPDTSVRWNFIIQNNSIIITTSAVIGSDGTIYFGASDGNLYALDPSHLTLGQDNILHPALKWTFSTGTGEAIISSSPAIAQTSQGPIIYVTSSSGSLFAVDANGKSAWPSAFSAGTPIKSSPAVGPDGTVYFGAGGTVYAIYGTNGSSLASSDWPMYGRNLSHTFSQSPGSCVGTCAEVRNAQISTSTFSFDCYASAGTTWTVYSSVDLNNWAPFGSPITITGGHIVYTDSSVSGVTHRFYKLSNGDCCSQPIGFDRVTVSQGDNMIANQFDTPTNTIESVFSQTTFPNRVDVNLWDGTQWEEFQQNGSTWTPNGTTPLDLGTGVDVYNPNSASFTVNFAGLVREGHMVNRVPSGTSLLASMLPQTGTITTCLGFGTPNNGDELWKWNLSLQAWDSMMRYYDASHAIAQGYASAGWYDEHGNTTQPTIGLGEAFWFSGETNNFTADYDGCAGVASCGPTLSNGHFNNCDQYSFTVTGPANSSWTVYNSNDGINWIPVVIPPNPPGTLDLGNSGVVNFTDTFGPSRRYYKLDDGVCHSATLDNYSLRPIISTYAGDHSRAGTYYGNNIQATMAGMNNPIGIAFDANWDLFIADTWNGVVRNVNGNRIISDVPIGGFSGPSGVTVNGGTPGSLPTPNLNLYVANADSCNLFEFQSDGSGVFNPTPIILPGPCDPPQSVTVDSSGNLFLVANDGTVAEIDTLGNYTALASISAEWYCSPNSAACTVSQPAVDSLDNVYVADPGNNIVIEISGGTVTTIAGNTSLGGGYSGDGKQATQAQLNQPTGVAVDAAGNVYIADSGNNVIRKVSPCGTISTFAGTGVAGYGPDSVPAVYSQLNAPSGMAFDPLGNLYISDTGNSVIRKVTLNQ